MKHLASVITFCALCAALPASAQEDQQEAQRLDAEAKQLFEDGEFAAAAERFGQAYDRLPHPSILSSQIVAYYKAGDCSALQPLAEKLAPDVGTLPEPTQVNVSIVRTDCVLEEAEDALEADETRRAAALVARAEELDEFDRRGDEIAALRADIDAAEVEQPTEEPHQTEVYNPDAVQPPPATEATRDGPPVLGWVLTGAGVAMLGTQTAISLVWADESARYRALRGECSESDCSALDPEESDELETLHDKIPPHLYYLQYPLWIGGGVLTAVGLGILVFHRGPKDTEIGLSITPHGAAVRGTF